MFREISCLGEEIFDHEFIESVSIYVRLYTRETVGRFLVKVLSERDCLQLFLPRVGLKEVDNAISVENLIVTVTGGLQELVNSWL